MKIPNLAPFKDELLKQAEEAKKEVGLEKTNFFEITLFIFLVRTRTTIKKTTTFFSSSTTKN
jgi:hypothetical protein